MNKINLLDNVQKLVTQRNIFLFFSCLLSVAVVVLSCFVLLKRERVVFIPTVGPSLWVEEEKVSNSYLEKFGVYLSDLLLTRTPSDVERKNQIILEHVHPAFYHEAKRLLTQDKETIAKDGQSLLFQTARSFINPEKQTYVVEGELMVFIGKNVEAPSCVQREYKKFTLGFECLKGRLLLKSLKREEIQ